LLFSSPLVGGPIKVPGTYLYGIYIDTIIKCDFQKIEVHYIKRSTYAFSLGYEINDFTFFADNILLGVRAQVYNNFYTYFNFYIPINGMLNGPNPLFRNIIGGQIDISYCLNPKSKVVNIEAIAGLSDFYQYRLDKGEYVKNLSGNYGVLFNFPLSKEFNFFTELGVNSTFNKYQMYFSGGLRFSRIVY
jgi:hypothetical protein